MLTLEPNRMVFIRMIFAAAVTSLLTMPTLAEQPIKGAFGIMLGDRLPSSIVDDGFSPSDQADGYVAVFVDPPEPNNLFRTYQVTVEKSSRRVTEIFSRGIIDGKEQCLTKLEDLSQFLSNKYGGEIERRELESEGLETSVAVIDPPRSPVFVAVACGETNSIDGGFFEKGFLDGDDETTYLLMLTYSFKSTASSPKTTIDPSGL